MAKRKRIYREQEEYERFVENLHNGYGRVIKDRDSLEASADNYMFGKNDKIDRNKLFNYYNNKYPLESTEREFTKAGGKSLAQDRKTTSKTIVNNFEEYKRRGSKNVDLKGYDTKMSRGVVKGRIVVIKPVKVKFKNKTVIRYRDSKGRFAKKV